MDSIYMNQQVTTKYVNKKLHKNSISSCQSYMLTAVFKHAILEINFFLFFKACEEKENKKRN